MRTVHTLGSPRISFMLSRSMSNSLTCPEIFRDQCWFFANFGVETVAEAVGRVGADHQCPVAELRAPNCSRRRDGGFAHAALAGIQEYAHQWTILVTNTPPAMIRMMMT